MRVGLAVADDVLDAVEADLDVAAVSDPKLMDVLDGGEVDLDVAAVSGLKEFERVLRLVVGTFVIGALSAHPFHRELFLGAALAADFHRELLPQAQRMCCMSGSHFLDVSVAPDE